MLHLTLHLKRAGGKSEEVRAGREGMRKGRRKVSGREGEAQGSAEKRLGAVHDTDSGFHVSWVSRIAVSGCCTPTSAPSFSREK